MFEHLSVFEVIEKTNDRIARCRKNGKYDDALISEVYHVSNRDLNVWYAVDATEDKRKRDTIVAMVLKKCGYWKMVEVVEIHVHVVLCSVKML